MSTRTQYPSLDGRAVLITGGATGIGAAMVEAFGRQGAKVGFVDLDADAAQRLAERLEGDNLARPWYEIVDVTDVPALKASLHRAVDSLGPLSVLVNNVANDTRHDPMAMDEDGWRACMAVNLDAAFFASQSAFESMRAAGQGSIVNLGSINALLGPKNMPGYVTAKAGVMGMTKALARDFGDAGVRVNSILPGWVVTERQLDTWLTPEAEAGWMKQQALGRRLMPDDVANLAMFLASDDSAMITGQSFVVDGGRT